jgi:hypothetical protein
MNDVDTQPAPAPTPEERTAQVVDYLLEEFKSLRVREAERDSLIERIVAAVESPGCPEWARHVMDAVQHLPPARLLEQRVVMHGEEIAALTNRVERIEGGCYERHPQTIVPPPPNGSG